MTPAHRSLRRIIRAALLSATLAPALAPMNAGALAAYARTAPLTLRATSAHAARPPLARAAAAPTELRPQDIHRAYSLPTSSPANATIAIVVAYDHPGAQGDLGAYSAFFGLPRCNASGGCFRTLNQRGKPAPLPGGDPTGGMWSTEAAAGSELARGVCQSCSILLVEADSDSSVDLSAAVAAASQAGAKIVLTTFYVPEVLSDASLAADYSHPGTAVVAATGDSGYTGAATFPAALADVVAVGGTRLGLSTSGGYGGETAWSSDNGASTSGCSLYTPAPPWQVPFAAALGCAGKRAIADIAAVAEPGALVRVSGVSVPGGPWYDASGTSVSAPVIAGALALAGGAGAGSPTQLLYGRAGAAPGAVHDVSTGTTSRTCGGMPICSARRGFDGPTGLGTPDGLRVFGGLDPRYPGADVLVKRGQLRVDSGWSATLTLGNSNPFAVTASLTLRSTARLGLGHDSFVTFASLPATALAAGERMTVSLGIDRRERGLLRRLGSVRVSVLVNLHDASGRGVTARATLTLHAR